MALRNAKGYLNDLKQRTKTIKDNRDSIEIMFKKVTQEKNDMYTKFEEAIN